MPAPKRDSAAYTVGFTALVCLLCAVPIASAAVLLKPRQAVNQRVDRLSKVLTVAGLVRPGERLSTSEVEERFAAHVVPVPIDLGSGRPAPELDAAGFDPRKAAKDPEASAPAPANAARVLRVPKHSLVYEVRRKGKLDAVILPIQGYGLWSTMYGYLALEADGRTVAGITFYEHGETPGLGGEIENPTWQAKWKGRRALGDDGAVKLRVMKGAAGPPADDPFRVDGLSGATITSRGVAHTLDFWLGPHGFGPYLAGLAAQRGQEAN